MNNRDTQYDANDANDALTRERPKRTARIVVVAVIVGALLMGGAAIAWAMTQPGSGDGRAGGDHSQNETGPDESRQSESSSPASFSAPADCPKATVDVTTADELQAALDGANAGDVILLAPGRYTGEFIAAVDGAVDEPITLCGTRESILDGGGIKGGYVLHLENVAHWVLQGFSVQNGQKGVMADGTTDSVIAGLEVSGIGDEAIHLRSASTDNVVIGNTISDTGLRKPKFGEGVYVGTAESNWCDISDCEPDKSDRNVIEGNEISRTTSESVDIKEGTSDGILRDNTFDGSDLVGADSWVDVKGNDWVIQGNTGTDSPGDGFQTHEILDGWGTRNVFRANTALGVDPDGLAFSLKPERENVLECDNTVAESDAELSNVSCRG